MPLRRTLLGIVAVVLPAIGCYQYVPVESAATPVGQLVELEITDPGRVSLAPRFGPGLDRITGRLVSQQTNDLTLSVVRVQHIGGENTLWSGEAVNLDRGFVGSVRSRKFSVARSVVVALGVGTVLYFTAGRGLVGGGSDPKDPPDPIDPPIRTRIPSAGRVRLIIR